MTNQDPPADNAPEATPAPVTPPETALEATPETPDTPPTDDTSEPDPVAEAVKKATNKANREAQNLRKRLKEFEDAEQARQDAALSETELLKKQIQDANESAAQAKKQAQEAALRAAIAVEAGRLNIVDPDAALALVDQSTIEHTDDGNLTGVPEALAALVEAKPYLVATPGNPRLDPNNGGRREAPDLTPQQQTEQLWASRRGGSIWQIPKA